MSEPTKKLRPRPSLVSSAPTPTPSPAFTSSGKKKARKQVGCGQCAACQAADCRQCVYCVDMRKYGGPNRLRKRCVERRCTGNIDDPKGGDKKQLTRSKREIKQPKKLTPNHSSALTYDSDGEKVGDKRNTNSNDAAPPAKRRKLEYPSAPSAKKPPPPLPPKKNEEVVYKYGSGKRLAPPPTERTLRPRSLPPAPKLAEVPSPVVEKPKAAAPQFQEDWDGKIKKRKYAPKSLPFLAHTDIAGVIVRYEIRARNTAIGAKGAIDGNEWRLEEVINFFRGVYLFGWGDWKSVRKMIKTRSITQIEAFAAQKLKRYPELRRFFGRNNLRKLHNEYPHEKVKRLASVPVPHAAAAVDPALSGWKTAIDGGLSNLSVAVLEILDEESDEDRGKDAEDMEVEEDENVSVSSEVDWLKDSTPPFLLRPQDPTRGTFNNGKVAICLGGHVIETDTSGKPTSKADVIPDSSSLEPEIFDPKYRPSAPTANSQQIFIPGNRIYARWMNKDDLGSYGTWYPGFVQSSRVSPDQSDYDDGLCGFPNLVYDVRFDDGVLGKNVKADDIMIQNQYETWLKDLENYYSLPLTEDSTKELLSKGQHVYAKWVDPTDPDMHARWIRGIIISSNVEDAVGSGAITYHVKFADGDEDEELTSDFVLTDANYEALLQQKIDQGKRQSISGFDLIHAASKISSPIKTSRPPLVNSSTGGALIPELDEDEDDNNSYATIESELLCHEVLEPPSPVPTLGSEDSSAPRIHYGLYMTTKPVAITPFSEPMKKVVGKSEKKVNTDPTEDVEMADSGKSYEEKKSDDNEDAISKEHQEKSKKADALAALIELSQKEDGKPNVATLKNTPNTTAFTSNNNSSAATQCPISTKSSIVKLTGDQLKADKVKSTGATLSTFDSLNGKETGSDFGLSQEAKVHLWKWFEANKSNPFPTKPEKEKMLTDLGLVPEDIRKIEGWFSRQRKKIKKAGEEIKRPAINPTYINPHYEDTTRRPSTQEVDSYLHAWLARPENASNFNPNQALREQMEAETGIEMRRIESWFYRLRKKMKKHVAAVNGSGTSNEMQQQQPSTGLVTHHVPMPVVGSSKTVLNSSSAATSEPKQMPLNADNIQKSEGLNPKNHETSSQMEEGLGLLPSTSLSMPTEKKTALTQASEPQQMSHNDDDTPKSEVFKPKQDVTTAMKPHLSQAEMDISTWCHRWIFDIFQESYNNLDKKVQASLNPLNSKENFGQILISWQLKQMRILKDYISQKERKLGVTLSEKERGEITYICTESFVQLVSEVNFQLKGDIDTNELSYAQLFGRYKRICRQVRSETLNNVKNV